jgi:multiple sugar transport system ATP-binding protein
VDERSTAVAGRGLALVDIVKGFGAAPILRGVTIEAEEGEFIALVGPSGCGKTTLLRIAAGLDMPDAGRVELDGREVTALRPADRDIAMVFQSYALYPHLTAAQNMAVPLAMRRLNAWQRLPVLGPLLPGTRATAAGIQESVRQAAAALKIEALLERKPGQMSGGQRQRVALGRALVRQPRAFLMDEPLSNLDASLRVHMRGEIVDLHRQAGVTTLYVTHDQAEALGMADRVAVMIGGRLLQLAPPETVYRDPEHQAVAEFIGSPRINLFRAEIDGLGRALVEGAALLAGVGLAAGAPATIGIRPEHLELRPSGASGLAARLLRVEFQGAELVAHLALQSDDTPVIAKLPPGTALPSGPVHLAVAPGTALLFDGEGRRIRVPEAPPLRAANHG